MDVETVQTRNDLSISPLARKILEYLRRNPTAQDSVDGIVKWWLLDQYIEEQTRAVESAVDELVRSHLVTEVVGADGSRRYGLLGGSE